MVCPPFEGQLVKLDVAESSREQDLSMPESQIADVEHVDKLEDDDKEDKEGMELQSRESLFWNVPLSSNASFSSTILFTRGKPVLSDMRR